jgi:hypothetical protein
MSEELEPLQGYSLDLAAAEVRADTTDIDALIEALAARLEDALGRLVSVKRRKVGGFRSKQTEVQSIVLDVADQRFELARSSGGFACTSHAVVRGITLRREERPIAQWLQEVVAAVTLQAEMTEQQRVALERLVA